MLSLNAEVDTTSLATIRTHNSFHRNEPYYAKVPGFNYLAVMSHNSLQADNLDRQVELRQTDRFKKMLASNRFAANIREQKFYAKHK